MPLTLPMGCCLQGLGGSQSWQQAAFQAALSGFRQVFMLPKSRQKIGCGQDCPRHNSCRYPAVDKVSDIEPNPHFSSHFEHKRPRQCRRGTRAFVNVAPLDTLFPLTSCELRHLQRPGSFRYKVDEKSGLNPAVATARNPDRPSAQPVARKVVIARRVSCAAVGIAGSKGRAWPCGG